MADETLNITVVEDNGATNRLVQAVNNLAKSSDDLADSTDRSTAASRTANTARTQEAEATQRTATAAKGYIDAQGNYIRLVGSQANGVKQVASAQDTLTKSISAGTIEAGRAAAGYGPLNTAQNVASANGAAFNARVLDLNRSLASIPAPAAAAASGVQAVAPAVQATGAATQTANGWITQYRQSLFGVAPAGAAAAAGAGGAGGGITSSGGAASAATPRFTQLADAIRGVGSAASGTASVLAGLGVALGANAIIKVSDAYSVMQNKLRILTTDQTKLNDIMNTTFGIAQKTSTPLEAVGTLYGRLSAAAQRLGLTNKQAADATTALTLAFQASGASGVEAGRAIEQFNQGLAKGKLEAQDFKSIVQAAPAFENAVVAGLQRIGVTITDSLMSALTEGRVSAKQMIDALATIEPTLAKFAAGAVPTLGNAMTRLQNSFTQFIGTSANTNSAMRVLIATIDLVGANMSTVIPIAVAFGAVLALGAIAGAITAVLGLAGAFATLTVAMAANPAVLAAIAVGLTVGAVAWNYYGGSISGIATKLGQYATASATAGQATTAQALRQQQLGAAYDNAAAKASAAAANVQATSQAVLTAAPGTAAYTKAVNDNNAALSASNTASKDAADAQKILSDDMNRTTTATKESGAALAAHTRNVNQFGEQLESTESMLRRYAEAQRAAAEQTQRFYEEGLRAADALSRQYEALQNLQTQLASTIGTFTSFDSAIAGSNAALSQGQSNLGAYAATADAAASSFDKASSAAKKFFDIGQSAPITGLDPAAMLIARAGAGQADPTGAKVAAAYNILNYDPNNQTAIKYLQDIQNNAKTVAELRGTKYSDSSTARAIADAQSIIGKGGKIEPFATGGSFIVGNPASVEHFAGGGSFMVGGSGGTDSQLVQFMASPNERVTVETPGQVMPTRQTMVTQPQRRVQPIVNVAIKADDYGQFKRSQRQIAQDLGERVGRAF